MAEVEVFGEPTEEERAAAYQRRRQRYRSAARAALWSPQEVRSVVPTKTVEVQTRYLHQDAWASAAVLAVGCLAAFSAALQLGAVGASDWSGATCTVVAGSVDSGGTCDRLYLESSAGSAHSINDIALELGQVPSSGAGCSSLVGQAFSCFTNDLEDAACVGDTKPDPVHRYVSSSLAIGIGITVAIASGLPLLLWGVRYCMHNPELPYAWAYRSYWASVWVLAFLGAGALAIAVAAMLVPALGDVRSTQCVITEVEPMAGASGSVCSSVLRVGALGLDRHGVLLDGVEGLSASAVSRCTPGTSSLIGTEIDCWYRRSQHRAQEWRPPRYPEACPSYGAQVSDRRGRFYGELWTSRAGAPQSYDELEQLLLGIGGLLGACIVAPALLLYPISEAVQSGRVCRCCCGDEEEADPDPDAGPGSAAGTPRGRHRGVAGGDEGDEDGSEEGDVQARAEREDAALARALQDAGPEADFEQIMRQVRTQLQADREQRRRAMAARAALAGRGSGERRRGRRGGNPQDARHRLRGVLWDADSVRSADPVAQVSERSLPGEEEGGHSGRDPGGVGGDVDGDGDGQGQGHAVVLVGAGGGSDESGGGGADGVGVELAWRGGATRGPDAEVIEGGGTGEEGGLDGRSSLAPGTTAAPPVSVSHTGSRGSLDDEELPEGLQAGRDNVAGRAGARGGEQGDGSPAGSESSAGGGTTPGGDGGGGMPDDDAGRQDGPWSALVSTAPVAQGEGGGDGGIAPGAAGPPPAYEAPEEA